MRLRAILALLVVSLLVGIVPFQSALADAPLDYAIPNGHFYQQANGQGGAGNTGYAVTDENGIAFWTWFQRYGGVNAVGYPVSQRFMWKGFTCQAFQKVVFQWRPESNSVMFVNVFDEMTAAGKDDWLTSAKMTPKSSDWSIDSGKGWQQVVANHYVVLEPNPAIKQAYNGSNDPINMNGLPMGGQDFGSAYVVRAQRMVYQQWKQDMPWAKAGQVVVANGGDLGKEAGLYPAEAIVPHPWGNNPAPTPTPAPHPAAPVINGFYANPNNITAGQATTLSWGAVTGATMVVIDNGIGGVAAPGSRVVTPQTTTNFTITAAGPGGSVSQSVTVYVHSQPQPVPVPPVAQINPGNGYTEHVNPSITFSWNSAGNYTYGIEVEQGLGNFWAPFASQSGISGTQFSVNFPDDSHGRWRVWAVDPATGKEGPKSTWWNFNVSLMPQGGNLLPQ